MECGDYYVDCGTFYGDVGSLVVRVQSSAAVGPVCSGKSMEVEFLSLGITGHGSN